MTRTRTGNPGERDHIEKRTLFRLLDAEKASGIQFVESRAMTPAASVSGLYLAHPGAHYFAVGEIEGDQVADYARRGDWDLTEAERRLAPILNHEP
ncbi:MAG: vitamin B12 dependent-methionine synthase activation domain-containing protein [Caulobacteraceae bacterium]